MAQIRLEQNQVLSSPSDGDLIFTAQASSTPSYIESKTTFLQAKSYFGGSPTPQTVTQITSASTPVTINAQVGNIITVSLSGIATFVVTNSFYTSTSQVILCSVANLTNTLIGAYPFVFLSALTPGSNQFTVNVAPNSGTFNGTVIVSFAIY